MGPFGVKLLTEAVIHA